MPLTECQINENLKMQKGILKRLFLGKSIFKALNMNSTGDVDAVSRTSLLANCDPMRRKIFSACSQDRKTVAHLYLQSPTGLTTFSFFSSESTIIFLSRLELNQMS